jgi:glyoxylase I family protein
MNFEVEHVGLPARNPAELRDWYVNVLGARLLLATAQVPPAYFVALGSSVVLEIYQAAKSRDENSDNSLAGFRHLALSVSKIEEAQSVLTSRGVAWTEQIKPAGGGGRVLFFKDVEGNLLHLVERDRQSAFQPPKR